MSSRPLSAMCIQATSTGTKMRMFRTTSSARSMRRVAPADASVLPTMAASIAAGAAAADGGSLLAPASRTRIACAWTMPPSVRAPAFIRRSP